MGDRGGRGRGRGRGGRGGQTQTIKNLEKATADIQNMLQKMTTKDDQSVGGDGGANRGKGPKQGGKQATRGSKSLMDINVNVNPQWSGPPHPNPGYHPRPPNQGVYNQGPPHQGLMGQAPYYQPPMGQAPPYQPPMGQPPHYQPPMGQMPHYPGPPSQGPYPHAPPPSYDESSHQYGDRSKPSPAHNKAKPKGKAPDKGTKGSVSAQQLVKTVAMFNGQMADSKTISLQLESSTDEVEKVVKQRKDIFSHMKDGDKVMVELVPNLKLCSHYLSESGCRSRETCQALHLCRDFIVTRCDQGGKCSYGHKMDTNHNTSILSKMYLDLIETRVLLGVIRKVCRGNAPPRICGYYSTADGCRKKDNCYFLHVCKDYVMNDGKCTITGCSFNHQLTHKQCKTVLSNHGMSTNESIRDILVKLKSSLERSSGPPSSAEPAKETKKKDKKPQESSDDSSDSDSSQDSSDPSVKKKKRNKSRDKDSKSGGKSKGKNYTVKSTDFIGDVEIPEVCIYAVNNKCLNEKKGCKYLHAKSLFHWQVKKEKKWYNFRIFQSKTLENAYRDVVMGGVKMPSIDADKLSPEDKKMLDLLGTKSWTADFKEMCIEDSANNKLPIRRVSTPSSAVSSFPQATVYEWYFADKQGKWIRYGQIDSLGKQDLVCSMTSEDIEKQYTSDASSTLIISNTLYKYKIDFTNMTQSNMSTNKVREIRRRPSRLSYQKPGATTTTTTSTASDSSLPGHWEPMTPQQTHVLVTLEPIQAEFQDVCKMIKLMIPTAKILQIRRLQNEYLWRLFQIKKADLSSRYDDATMNVQKLYHGTCSESINAITKENIDGRRYINNKDKYGKGTYFSNSPAVARNYCTPDGQGHLFLILAEVIIGYVTLGAKSHNRPPDNSQTGHRYDTTVDNVTAPTVFVKYEKEEYYPEYIIEMSL